MSSDRLNKSSLRKRFPQFVEAIRTYKQPDETFTINDDPYDRNSELKPITINIFWLIEKNFKHYSPIASKESIDHLVNPDWSKVAGFGKMAKDQWWEAPEIPVQLVHLEKQLKSRKGGVSVGEFWTEIEADPDKYAETIKYIKTMQYHIRYGYWFFNLGSPVWIEGLHFRQLCFFSAGTFESRDKRTGQMRKQALPEYRDRSRRKFMFYKWCLVDTTDHTGTDYKVRTCFGYTYPKMRRDGATSDALTILLDSSHSIKDSYNSLIGNADQTAKVTFQKKFIIAWRRQPLWLKPIHDGSDRPSRELNMRHPSRKAKGGVVVFNQTDTLESWIDYADKADRAYYDHAEINGAILLDEEGKTTATNIFEGWDTIRPTMAPGGGSQILRFSFAMHPSTVEEMESGGGENYFKLNLNSNYYQSDEIVGQTVSGLRRMFIPCYDGLAGYIGKYGESLIEELTDEQKKFCGKKFGAKEFIDNKIERLAKRKDQAAQDALDKFMRQHPRSWAECWKMQGSNNGFNKEKLSRRILTLKIGNNYDRLIRKGNLYWKIDSLEYSAQEYLQEFGKGPQLELNGQYNVVFREEPYGRFHLSAIPPPHTFNKKELVESDEMYHDYVFTPSSPEIYTASADTFKFLNKTEYSRSTLNTRLSLGGGAVFMNRNRDVDTDETPRDKWLTHHFVCDYLERPDSSDEYAEEMLMMSVYWGAMMFPEINIPVVYEHFVGRGFSGFLKYDIDPITGFYKEKPGFTTTAGLSSIKNQLFVHARGYIEDHIFKEKHLRILEQFSAIKGIEDMTNHDLFVAATGAIKGSKSTYADLLTQQKNTLDLSDFFESY